MQLAEIAHAASIKEQKGTFDVPDDSVDEEEGEAEKSQRKETQKSYRQEPSHRQAKEKVPMVEDENPVVCDIMNILFRQLYVLQKTPNNFSIWLLSGIKKNIRNKITLDVFRQ